VNADLLVNVALRVFKEIKDQWELWVNPDLREKREHPVLLEIKAIKVTKDLLEIKAIKVTRD
jgi:hypothetical protein